MEITNLKNLGILLALFLLSSIYSSAQNDESNTFEEIFGTNKKSATMEFMQINEDDESFWTVYNEYEKQRLELAKTGLELLKEYKENFLTMTPDKAKEIIKKTQKYRNDQDQLINKYYKQIKEISGTVRAAQFYQIENYYLSAIQYHFLHGLPQIM